MISQSISRYRIVSKIASGGMGSVYLARDTKLERSIALKVLPADVASDPGVLARFRQEARAIAAVNHPNIVVIHSVEEVGETNFITMELIEGRTLSDIMADQAIDLTFFFEIAVPLTSALEAAHAQGVTHRDLKPANIMVTHAGQVKVLDFGLAKMVRPGSEDPAEDARTETLIAEDLILGTPNYMSPEQVRSGPADNRSDIFAVGAVMYHLITGQRPFKGQTATEIMAAVMRDTPVPAVTVNPECPPRLSSLIERCLAKDPGKRFQDVSEVRIQLEEIRDQVAQDAEGIIHAIAVLPFADMSPQKDQEHFCTGIAEEIINALAGIDQLKVVSRMSSFQYRDLGGDTREIGRKLGVSTLLEGSVRKAGTKLRIITQLIDVSDGCHIWSQRFDRELRDIFEVQDEIAQSIVKVLRLTIDPDREKHLVEVRTDDPAAYDFYLRGREFFRRWGKRNIQIAQRMFYQASAIDPDFASAHAGLADTYSYLFMYINSSPENLEQADRNSARALELDPALAEAHASRGLALSLSKVHQAAARSFHTAIELDPHLFEAYYFYARDLVVQGQYEEAIKYYDKAHEASPDDYQIPILQAQIFNALGRTEEEEKANRLGMELAEKAILLNPEDARACYMGAGSMIRLGQGKRGLQWAKRALALDPDDPAILYNVACNLSGLGQVEEAIDCLERTVKVGAAYKDWMMNDTDLDPLREEERFKALVASLGQPD
jgi:serine/threonine protein kinase/tetratricopeptide (TPR) repeat protein